LGTGSFRIKYLGPIGPVVAYATSTFVDVASPCQEYWALRNGVYPWGAPLFVLYFEKIPDCGDICDLLHQNGENPADFSIRRHDISAHDCPPMPVPHLAAAKVSSKERRKQKSKGKRKGKRKKR
jgi:hypothetical protein